MGNDGFLSTNSHSKGKRVLIKHSLTRTAGYHTGDNNAIGKNSDS